MDKRPGETLDQWFTRSEEAARNGKMPGIYYDPQTELGTLSQQQQILYLSRRGEIWKIATQYIYRTKKGWDGKFKEGGPTEDQIEREKLEGRKKGRIPPPTSCHPGVTQILQPGQSVQTAVPGYRPDNHLGTLGNLTQYRSGPAPYQEQRELYEAIKQGRIILAANGPNGYQNAMQTSMLGQSTPAPIQGPIRSSHPNNISNNMQDQMSQMPVHGYGPDKDLNHIGFNADLRPAQGYVDENWRSNSVSDSGWKAHHQRAQASVNPHGVSNHPGVSATGANFQPAQGHVNGYSANSNSGNAEISAPYQPAQATVNWHSLSNSPGGATINAVPQPAPFYGNGSGSNNYLGGNGLGPNSYFGGNGFNAPMQPSRMDTDTPWVSRKLSSGAGTNSYAQQNNATFIIPGPSHNPGSAGPSLYDQSAPVMGNAGHPGPVTNIRLERADQRESGPSDERGIVFERDKTADVTLRPESELAEAIKNPSESEFQANGYPRLEVAPSSPMVGQQTALPTQGPIGTGRSEIRMKVSDAHGNVVENQTLTHPSTEETAAHQSGSSYLHHTKPTSVSGDVAIVNEPELPNEIATVGAQSRDTAMTLPPADSGYQEEPDSKSASHKNSPLARSGQGDQDSSANATGEPFRFFGKRTRETIKWCHDNCPHTFDWPYPLSTDENKDFVVEDENSVAENENAEIAAYHIHEGIYPTRAQAAIGYNFVDRWDTRIGHTAEEAFEAIAYINEQTIEQMFEDMKTKGLRGKMLTDDESSGLFDWFYYFHLKKWGAGPERPWPVRKSALELGRTRQIRNRMIEFREFDCKPEFGREGRYGAIGLYRS